MPSVADLTEFIQKKVHDLPPMPLVVQKLVRTLNDDKSSADDVMKVLSADQALASKVLKLVNSSFYGMSGEISTTSQAVVILGFAAIRNLAVGLSVAKFMALTDDNNGMRSFWDHSIATAAAGKIIARRTGLVDPEEAFIASLLHDIGQLVLDLALPDEYAEIKAQGLHNLVTNEQQAFGVGHARVGQMLLKHWKLPKNLTDAVRFHHTAKIFCGDADPLVSTVALADTLANVQGETYGRAISDTELFELISAANFDVATTAEVLQEIQGYSAEVRVFLEIASETAIESTEPKPVAGLRAVVISTNQSRVHWIRSILEYYNVEVVPMKTFFTNPSLDNEIDCVILDPASIAPDQLAKMQTRLAQTEVPLLLFGEDDDSRVATAIGRRVPSLPSTFSPADLNLDQ